MFNEFSGEGFISAPEYYCITSLRQVADIDPVSSELIEMHYFLSERVQDRKLCYPIEPLAFALPVDLQFGLNLTVLFWWESHGEVDALPHPGF